MAAGARRWSGRHKGWPARQRNSSLLVSARQLQALVRQHLPSDESGYRAGRRQSVAAPTNATTAAAAKTPTRMMASQPGPRNAAARTPITNVKRPAATDTLTMRHQVSATGSDAWDLRRWRS